MRGAARAGAGHLAVEAKSDLHRFGLLVDRTVLSTSRLLHLCIALLSLCLRTVLPARSRAGALGIKS